MKTADLAILVVVILATLAVIIAGILAFIRKRAGINVRHLNRVEAQNTLREDALYEVEMVVAKFDDIDHVLATEIRKILDKSRKDIRKL